MNYIKAEVLVTLAFFPKDVVTLKQIALLAGYHGASVFAVERCREAVESPENLVAHANRVIHATLNETPEEEEHLNLRHFSVAPKM